MSTPNPEPLYIESLDLKSLLAKFPEYAAGLFVQCEMRGVPEKEIAQRLGKSERTVTNHLSLIRSQLRNALTAAGYELGSVQSGGRGKYKT